MRKKLDAASAQEDLSVDLTLHSLPVALLEDFVVGVVKPFYGGSVSAAVKDLMQRAVADQKFVEDRIRQVNR